MSGRLMRVKRCLALFGLLCLTAVASGASKAAAPPAGARSAAPAAGSAHVVRRPVANAHLHLKPDAVKATKPPAGVRAVAPGRPAAAHRKGHARWHYAKWAAAHRGTGTVRGVVLGKAGRPVANARVVLRTSAGKQFKTAAARHATMTDTAGRFVMRGVRTGSYRVRAHKDKPTGHTAFTLRGGKTASLVVKF